jgi:signal transduction histidine kinase
MTSHNKPWKVPVLKFSPNCLHTLQAPEEGRFAPVLQPLDAESPFPNPVEKERRNKVLRNLEILDTPPEAEFDDLVALAAEICGAPISLISLIDSERQWFKATVGLAYRETPIVDSFCAQAINQDGLFVVVDATKDKRFNLNPLVLGEPHIRFYAGMPVYAGEGVPIGTLCVIDTVPRFLTPSQVKGITVLTHQVQALIELRSERKKKQVEMRIREELLSRIESSNQTLTESNQKLENLSVELEQRRLQHMANESELRKRSELDALKNEYVAMLSHELRSPLTSVRGAVGILSAGLMSPGTAKGSKLFEIAVTNLDRMIRLVNDVLNLERIASGASSLRMEQCCLDESLRQAIDTMMPIAQESDVTLVANSIAETEGPMLYFEGDADRILQVLINLLSNAVKFSPAGSHVVVDIMASSDELTVRISDAGRGIPEDQLEKVFERFRQVEQDDSRRLGGTGLGLAICRAIVEQHYGRIWAGRNDGKGTSFFVTLPRSPGSLEKTSSVGVRQSLLEGRVA